MYGKEYLALSSKPSLISICAAKIKLHMIQFLLDILITSYCTQFIVVNKKLQFSISFTIDYTIQHFFTQGRCFKFDMYTLRKL